MQPEWNQVLVVSALGLIKLLRLIKYTPALPYALSFILELCIKHHRRFGEISPALYFPRVFYCAYFGVLDIRASVLDIRASVFMCLSAAQGVIVDTLRERFL